MSRLNRIAVIGAVALALSAVSAPVALAQTLTPPPPASAACNESPAGTVCDWTEAFATPFPVAYGVSCASFSVRVNLSGERQVTAFYDAGGTLVRRIRHSTFSGTLINSVTGASVPHQGHFNIFDDLTAGTMTITGRLSRTVVPGEGLVWRNIGRIVLTGGVVDFEAGEHGTWDVLTDPTTAAQLCAALA